LIADPVLQGAWLEILTGAAASQWRPGIVMPVPPGQDGCVVTVDDVRAVLAQLPRSREVLVRDRVKFRVGQIVYVAFSQDETEIGFAFPKEERAALVAARPDVFFLPRESELRFHWVEAWLDALDADEMRELVLDAWRMVVPQRVAREVLGPPAASHEPGRPG
jgi:hypothetical protein